MKKLYLIDGHSYLYRAFYAIKNLSTHSGLPTNAVFGFTNMLIKILNEEPDMIAVAFDSSSPTLRALKYPDYKIHRKKMPDELKIQIPLIKEIINAFNIYHLEIPGYEADDILASLALKAEQEKIDEIIIFTNDKDMLQIVNEHIFVQSETNKPVKYNIEEVIKRFGISPDRVPDFLALTGDPSDNIPGVPGIGPKTATDLVQKFHTLDNLLNSSSNLENKKTKDLIIKYTDSAKLSYELIKLYTDIPINISIEECKIKKINHLKLKELLLQLEFTNLSQKLIPDEFNEIKAGDSLSTSVTKNYFTVDNTERFSDLISKLNNSSEFSLHVETASDSAIDTELVGIAFSTSFDTGFYIPLGHQYLGVSQLDIKYVLDGIKPILENPNIKKIGHNIKNDYIIFLRFGIKIKGLEFDTAIASYILNSSQRDYSLDSLSMEYLGFKKIPPNELTGKGKNQIPLGHVEIKTITPFACEYTDYTLQLKKKFSAMLKDKEMEYVFYELEIKLIPVLAQMEINGFKLNTKYLYEIKSQVDLMLKNYQKKIFEFAGEEFNINSPRELSKILFDKLKLPVQKKIKTGFSTNIDVLEELSLIHELPLLVLNYRQMTKLNSTYIEALPDMVNPSTGRLHTSFNQTITATGRLSSSNPNLQNIPIRSEFGILVRKAFVSPGTNWKLISGDYSQIELRILAHFSQDENLIQAFKNNEDIHTRTACELFNITSDKIDTNLRRIAKTINFGIIYGMSAYGLARDLKISHQQASMYIDNYFNRYPGVKNFIDRTINDAKEKKFVTTITGRKRYVNELFSSNKSIREFGERIAVNTILQGTAADLIKIAMIKIHYEFEQKNLLSKMILQIHDELIFEVPEKEIEEVSCLIKNIMEQAIIFNIPIKVDIKKGDTWFDL